MSLLLCFVLGLAAGLAISYPYTRLLTRQGQTLLAELRKRTDELLQLKREGFYLRPQPPQHQDHETWPDQILKTLARFPAELRGEQELWIREQRRHGAPWTTIYRHLTGGQELHDDPNNPLT